MERVFNLRAGFTDKDDWLPERFYTESLEIEGRTLVCNREAFSQMHLEYYHAMGWDKNGQPTDETFRQLGMDYLLANGPAEPLIAGTVFRG
jgi:aldehyde:ferredoxin oxidoreductase